MPFLSVVLPSAGNPRSLLSEKTSFAYLTLKSLAFYFFLFFETNSLLKCTLRFTDAFLTIYVVLHSVLQETFDSVGRTFLYNPLMLFYAISLGLSGDKENKKSLGSSVASDIRYKETTKETMRGSISNQEEEEEKGAR
jgi:hypothetical protein